MMGQALSLLAYLLTALLDLAALLLILEWFFHLVPGAGLNFIRRTLFQATYPLIQFSDRFFSIRWGSFHSRGFFMALLLLLLSRYGIPWLVLLSYPLRNG